MNGAAVRVVIEVLTGPSRGQRIRLQDGLVVRFGQTEWADFSFPDDPTMAEFHFLLDCRQQACVLHAMESAETQVNAAPVKRHPLVSGDRVLAGETEFLVHIDGVEASVSTEDRNRPRDPVAVAAAGMTVNELCQRLRLKGDAPRLAGACSTPDELVAALIGEKDYFQALRLRGFTLGRRPAVAWGCLLVAETFAQALDAAQSDAVRAAAAWVARPEEPTCRDAEVAANRCDHSGPGGWLALAAFWSGDSIAPADSPQPVPPDDSLSSQAVAAALTLAVLHFPPDDRDSHCQDFVSRADRIELGELVLYEA